MISDARVGLKHRVPARPPLHEFFGTGFTPRVPDAAEVEIAIADDDTHALALIEAFVQRLGHPVRTFTDSREALDDLTANPAAILVADIDMPEFTGIELVRRLRSAHPDVSVILVSGGGESKRSGDGLAPPAISFLHKPVGLEEFTEAVHKARLQHASDRHHRALVQWADSSLSRNAAELRDFTLGTLSALMNAMDARSPHFVGHSRAVAMHAAAIAQTLGLSSREIESIRTAGLLHDIGMIGVPDSVIDKPSSLGPAEYEMIRRHPETGASILAPMRHLGNSVKYIAQHHERWDGSGYPGGLRGEQISLGGQIVGIAEAWSGIIESRAFRDARSRAEAQELLLSHRDEWFSERVILALIESDIGIIS